MTTELLNRLYARQRGLEAGIDSDVRPLDVFEFAREKLFAIARGLVRGWPGSYFGPRVSIRHRRHLVLGKRVSIAAGTRINALSANGIFIGDSATIDVEAVIRGSGVIRNLGLGIKIGARTAVGARNLLLGAGGIEIGDDCLLGPNVTVLSENHRFDSRHAPIREQGESRAKTVIEDDVWVGANAVILGGSHIERGAIIAAGAVVRGHVPPFSIFGGVPARQIGERP